MAAKLFRLQERLGFLQKLLTKETVEQELNHFQRSRLLEEAEEAELELKEMVEECHANTM
jgi:hypothetical protein